MRCEILSTGDELRSGSVLDTNAPYITKRVEECGLFVSRHTCVGDNGDELIEVFNEIGERSDIAFVTGGLGPTNDDITAYAAAKASSSELVFSEEAFETVKRFFVGRNIEISESNKKQAYIPENATVIPNMIGTAPGFICNISGCNFFFLPGVPYEMKDMMKSFVIPKIMEMNGEENLFNIIESITLFNLPESKLGEMISPVENRYKNVQVGIRAKFPQLQIRLYGKGQDKDLVIEELAKAKKDVIEITSNWVVSNVGRTLEEELGEILKERNATIALAESCTGGLISSSLTDVSGSSDFFLFSGVTYSNDAKMKILGVSEDTLIKYGAVDVETAKEMAEGTRKVSGATYGISTSGIAGPTGGTDEKPVGTVCIGISSELETKGFKIVYKSNSRLINKRIFAAKALDLLRRYILRLEME
jgi:nicotinamide-nucleotide amidase